MFTNWGRRVLLVMIASGFAAFGQSPGKGLVIVLIGPPGSGKTTQSELLQKKYKIPVLAGNKLREQAGKSPDKLNALLREQVLRAERAKGFVIDGYPATRAEADYLGALVKEVGLPQPIIIQLDVPDDEVRQRMKGKTNVAEMEKELAQYHRELDTARSYYLESDIWTIIGKLPPKEVFQTIVSLVESRQ